MFFRTFRVSFAFTAVGLLVGALYGGWSALLTVAILGILEVSLSFDNAVMNATVLERMSAKWQRLFLTVGIFIAVFGMRLVFPLVIVAVTAGLTPVSAFELAMQGGSPETPGTYANEMMLAHPAIASFGGMFLAMIFFGFLFDGEREHFWLTVIERPAAKLGERVEQAPVIAALTILVAAAATFAKDHAATVLLAGVAGVLSHMVVSSLGDALADKAEDSTAAAAGAVVLPQVGKAAFMSFLYLEVLDATMSFDGVIGAFAVTVDPIIIAIGLGVIGAPYVRSITVYLVRQGTLKELVHLEHGAHWAIGALALFLMVSITVHLPEAVTGLVGVGFIAAAFATSKAAARRAKQQEPAEPADSELASV